MLVIFSLVVACVCFALIALVLFDGFEAMVLPRRVTHRFRPTRLFYRVTWATCRVLALKFKTPRRRQAFLGFFGPLSLLTLFTLWVISLIGAFAVLHWALHTPLAASRGGEGFTTYLYLSGVTFFTLGYGDVTPLNSLGRLLAVGEAGIGFGFMAIIIGYMPVLYQAFSQRERTIGLLDARAGSPPTAGELLSRLATANELGAINGFLHEWERWAAELLESHLSFPILSFYRSQHDNQSWLAALTAILDTCALLLVGSKGVARYQAQLTFAMARHAAVDLALVFWIPPEPTTESRLSEDGIAEVFRKLGECGSGPCESAAAEAKLTELRQMYEPFLNGLARYLLFTLPPMTPDKSVIDNWQTSAWTSRVPGIGKLPAVDDGHFR
jgi:hypothetical protein